VLLWIPVSGAQSLQIIELHYRLADQILPSLQPLVEPGRGLERHGFHAVRAHEPGNFEQIRQAVALLDRAPRQLLISVGQGTVEAVADSSVRGSATIGSDDVQVGINEPRRRGQRRNVQVRQHTQRANLQNVSSIRTREGNEAYVAGRTNRAADERAGHTGLSRTDRSPVHRVSRREHGVLCHRARQWRSRDTRYFSRKQQRLRGTPHGTVIDTASSVSTVSGRLGEWLPLGAVSESTDNSERGLLVWGRRSTESQYGAWSRSTTSPLTVTRLLEPDPAAYRAVAWRAACSTNAIAARYGPARD
jgi:hypothetical protein